MNNWKQEKLGNVADIKLSNVDKKTNENERMVRLCNYTDVYKNSFINIEKSQSFMVASCNENEHEKFILRKGQVAITKDSETPDDIGVSAYISQDLNDVVLGYHLSLLTPNSDKLNGRFLHYWLNTKQSKRYFENNAGGSGQRCTLTLDCIKSIPLYLPNLPTQKSIAKALSNLDSKIELNNRINKELEAMAKTLYDYWFVQFDFPISAEQAAAMAQPGLKGKPYKSSGGKMVWNKELKREIPEGWEVKELAEITSLISRGISPKYLDDGGSCVINQKCVRQGTILYEQARRNDENQRDSSNKRIALFDILVNSTGVGTLGRVSMVRRLPEQKITVDSHVTIVRANEKLIHKLYFGYMLLQKQLEIERFSLGSTGQVELSRSQLETIKVILPSAALQNTFEKYYRPICEQLANNEEQNQQLASLRDWLLPMLMNGQVKVGAADSKTYAASEGMDVAAEAGERYMGSKNFESK